MFQGLVVLGLFKEAVASEYKGVTDCKLWKLN